MPYPARVQAVIDFIELLTVPSGVGAGGQFRMRPFQRDFLAGVYGPVKNGRRVVRRAIKSIARKNGKTAEIACLVLCHLAGPEQVMNGEIYSAANERDQAAIVFKYVAQIVRAEPELEAMLKIVDSTKTIVNYANGTVYRAISAEAGSKHGLNPTVVIYDELAQAKNPDLFNVLDTSFGAREEPLMIIISTQSPDPQHILSQLIDDGLTGSDQSIFVQLHAVPDDCDDIWNPEVWKLANPALGDFRDFDDLAVLAARAKRMPSFESAFRNLYLNQRIDAKSPLIARSEWMACKFDECRIEPGQPVYLALDLSSTTDLCALAMITDGDEDRICCWFWKPGDLLKEHEDRDHVPYTAWESMGLIEAPPGRAIDYGHVAQKLAEIQSDYEVKGLAYDRWRVDLLKKELVAIGIEVWIDGKDPENERTDESLRMVMFGQGYKDMAPAVDALETSIIERRMKHDGNPVLTWCVSNAMAVTDPAGNRKLDKSKSRFRIDGAIAMVMAKGLKAKDQIVEPEPEPRIRTL